MTDITKRPTPRTDAREQLNSRVLCGSANLDLARTLERENAESVRLLEISEQRADLIKIAANEYWDEKERLRAERDSALAQLAEAKGNYDVMYDHHGCPVVLARIARTLEQQRDEAREQRDALREALEYVLGPKDDEKIGWRRNTCHTVEFTCEFCGKKHEDVTLIEHQPDCPGSVVRTILGQIPKP